MEAMFESSSSLRMFELTLFYLECGASLHISLNYSIKTEVSSQ